MTDPLSARELAQRLDQADAVADPARAHALRRDALRDLVTGQPPPLPPHAAACLVPLSRKVHLHTLDAPTLAALARHAESTGAYDRAEDVLFTWLDLEPDAAFDAGMAFYERMWGLPEARLTAGGLTSNEVLEGMRTLQQRLGRK